MLDVSVFMTTSLRNTLTSSVLSAAFNDLYTSQLWVKYGDSHFTDHFCKEMALFCSSYETKLTKASIQNLFMVAK